MRHQRPDGAVIAVLILTTVAMALPAVTPLAVVFVFVPLLGLAVLRAMFRGIELFGGAVRSTVK